MIIPKHNERDCVEFLTGGRNSWKLDHMGILNRKRGIVVSVGIGIVLMTGPPWWWDSWGFIAYSTYLTLSFIAVDVCMLVGGIVYLRWWALRSLEIKYRLHELTHGIRDKFTEFCLYTAHGQSDLSQPVRNFAHSSCVAIRNYMSPILQDSDLGVAVRLASYVPVEKPGEKAGHMEVVHGPFYKTAGRANLCESRAITTEDISACEGVPGFLLAKGSHGILRYNNLEKAISIGAFRKTMNEDLFSHEVRTLAVAPMNAWDGERHRMIGILYLTSKKSFILPTKHVDTLKALADLMAVAFASVIHEAKRTGPTEFLNRPITMEEN